MKFKNVHLRIELKNGDVCVCHLVECNWNKTGICLAVYYDGQFYDAQVEEDNMMPRESWKLVYDDGDTIVCDYCFTGENVELLK